MLLTFSRALLALVIATLLVFIVGTPIAVRYAGSDILDTLLQPLGFNQVGGTLSFNPLKLTLTGEQLVFAELPADPLASSGNRAVSDPSGGSRHGEIKLLTLDILKRELTISNGKLQTGSIGDLLTATRAARQEAAITDSGKALLPLPETRVGNWLQPLRWIYFVDSSKSAASGMDWTRQELIDKMLDYAIRSVSINDFRLELSNTDAVMQIGTLKTSRTRNPPGESPSKLSTLHNWSATAQLNGKPFNLAVEPRKTTLGTIYYLDLQDVQFDATAFDDAGMRLPPIAGLSEDLKILEGSIGLKGELVVEYEAERRALTAIDLELTVSGMHGEIAARDKPAPASMTFRNEQLTASFNQLQWLADTPDWRPEQVRLTSRMDLNFSSMRSADSLYQGSSKSISGDLLLDWKAGEIVQLHSDRLSARSIKAELASVSLPGVDAMVRLCGMAVFPEPPAALALELDSSVEIEDLSLFSGNCTLRQLLLDGNRLALQVSDSNTSNLEPLQLQSHRLQIVGLGSTAAGQGPSSLELTGRVENGSISLNASALDNRLEQVRLGASSISLFEASSLAAWAGYAAGFDAGHIGEIESRPGVQRITLLVELERIGSAFTGLARIVPDDSKSAQQSATLDFANTSETPLINSLWRPLAGRLKTLIAQATEDTD